MNTPRVLRTAGSSGVLFLLVTPAVLGLDVSESVIGDIPTNAGPPYTLALGTNTFSGAMRSSPPDQRDAFAVTIPAGLQLRSVTKNVTGDAAATGVSITFNSVALTGNGAGSFSIPSPLQPGNYTTIAAVSNSTGTNWTMTFTLEAIPHYVVNTTGSQMVLTDLAGAGETLTISQPAAGQIRFAAPGRNFSVNGGTQISGNSGDISLSGITGVTVDPGNGADTVNVGGFPGTSFPSLTINGTGSDDAVNLNGDIYFTSARSLTVTAQALTVATDANLVTDGTGTVNVTCSRNVSLNSGSSLETVNGNLSVQANQQSPAMTGNFLGVSLGSFSALRTTGSGTITVKGRGGNDAGGAQLGVGLFGGSTIMGGSGAVSVTGTGGASTNWINRGVTVYDPGTVITSNGGNVSVTGTGGSSSSFYGIGVAVLNGGQIRAGGAGTLTVTGTGAGIGGGSHQGVELGGTNSRIISAKGNVTVKGTAGPGGSSGLLLSDSGGISTPSGGGNVLIEANSMEIQNTTFISSAAASSSVTLRTTANLTQLNLGGADDNSSSPKVLGLTDAELDRISTPNLVLSSLTNADLFISQPVSPTGASEVTLNPSTSNGRTLPSASGTDVTLPAGGVLKLDGPLACPITGPAPDSGYPQLKVAGGVNLNNAALSLAESTLPVMVGDSFTVVDNDGGDPVTGIFQDLPEGGAFAWPGSPALSARVSYTGGDGNDVVLTVVDPLLVSNTDGQDTGYGSLRKALEVAAENPGPDTIRFAPSLSGQLIVLIGEIIITDPDGVTLDPAGLSGGLALTGNNNCRMFHVKPGASLTLKGLGFIFGNGTGTSNNGSGGAIRNDGTLNVQMCTFYRNTALTGGAISNQGVLAITRSTFTVNNVLTGGGGGAIHNAGDLALNHCTLSGNEATGNSKGGGIFHTAGGCTLSYNIIAGNTAAAGPGSGMDIHSDNATLLAYSGPNLIQQVTGDADSGPPPISAPAELGGLADNGGTTGTMGLHPNSPARDAATGSGSTEDQRGMPVVGVPDLGAYESGNFFRFQTWSAETLGGVTGFGDDSDKDGATNGLEYATRGNPNSGDGQYLPTLAGPAGGRIFSFPYQAAARDVVYIVQRGSDLTAGGWQEIYRYNSKTSSITQTGITSAKDAGTQMITITDPTTGPRLFWRLRIEPAQ